MAKTTNLPKPEQFPDFCLEINHDTRECILLQCENADEHKAWCDMLHDCRWYSSSRRTSSSLRPVTLMRGGGSNSSGVVVVGKHTGRAAHASTCT